MALERLGPVPDVDIRKGLFVEGRADRPLRSGIQLGTTLRVSSEQLGFAGKPLDPAFGGRFVPVRFPSFVELHGDVPLGKGRGSVSATGTERAAEFAADAARETLRHQIAEDIVPHRGRLRRARRPPKSARGTAADSLEPRRDLRRSATRLVEAGEIRAGRTRPRRRPRRHRARRVDAGHGGGDQGAPQPRRSDGRARRSFADGRMRPGDAVARRRAAPGRSADRGGQDVCAAIRSPPAACAMRRRRCLRPPSPIFAAR